MRVIWSLCHIGGWNKPYVFDVIQHAAKQGVWGIELVNGYVDQLIGYRDFPELARVVDSQRLAARQADFHEICDAAKAAGLQLGIWHHEVGGPEPEGSLLKVMPALAAADGLIDLESPLLYRLITSRVAEFLDTFPHVSQIVLTMTETAYPVMHRPFCTIPAAERIRRVLQAVVDATEPRGKTLVIRPFSALREDEENTHRAVEQLKGQRVAMMYKTEPADWHPFLPNETAIGSVKKYECRAETDCGSEYYGQNQFACVHTRHIDRRLSAAAERGASVFVLRVDRGWFRPALGHPTNELNIVPATRWLLGDRKVSLQSHVESWIGDHYPSVNRSELAAALERTFEVVSRLFYIDQQAITHRCFPMFDAAKHVQAFAVFEENVPLDHLSRNWAMLADRRSLSHEGILQEQSQALALAEQLAAQVRALLTNAEPVRREAVVVQMDRLIIVARAMLQWTRVVLAHLQEVWKRPVRLTENYAIEAARLCDMADEIDRTLGPDFFGFKRGGGFAGMSLALRSLLDGLERERNYELPQRCAIEAENNVLDYVLAGLASEGHRFSKRLHSGSTGFTAAGDASFRATGLGEGESLSYLLTPAQPAAKAQLSVDFVLGAQAVQGIVQVGSTRHAIALPAQSASQTRCSLTWLCDATQPMRVTIWSTSVGCVSVQQIVLRRA